MRKQVYILFFVLLSPQAFAQEIDSLKLALNNAKHDTIKIKILYELSDVCEVNDIIEYAEPCIKLCEKNLALSPTPPLNFFYFKYLAGALNNKGFFVKENGNNEKALYYYQKALKIDESIKNKEGIANSLNNIGLVYDNIGDISKALEYYHRSLKIREELDNKQDIATSLNNIGALYKDQGDLTKGLDYFLRSLKIYEVHEDKEGLAFLLNNIGTLYSLKKDYRNSLEVTKKSLAIFEELKIKQGIALTLGNIGANYKNVGDLNHALEFFFSSLIIQKEIKESIGITYSLNYIASVFLLKGETNKAYLYATQSMEEAKKTRYPSAIETVASTLKNIYKKKHNFKKALAMYELELQMRDSIINESTKKASIQKQFQYEYEKKATADSIANAKANEIKNAQIAQQHAELKAKRNQQIALYGGLLLVLVFAGFMYNRFKVTQKQKVVIEQQKEVVEQAHHLLEEKNEEIIASIRYAKRIQDSLLTSQKYIARNIQRLKETKTKD